MRAALALLIAIVAFASGLQSAAARGPVATFGAGPASAHKLDGRSFFSFGASPGGEAHDHIAVINQTHHSETLDVYPVDAVSATNGNLTYATKAAKRIGAGAWIAVGTPNASGLLTLRPRSTTIVPLELRVPANAPPGDHVGAVIVSLTALVKGKSGEHVDLEQRVATRVLVRVSGPLKPALSVEGLKATYSNSFASFGSGHAVVSYTVHNTGNVILGGAQQVSVKGLFGSSATASRLPTIPPLLPGAAYPVTVHVADVFPELLMHAKVRIVPEGLVGDVNPAVSPSTSSAQFWAIPWLIVIIILALLLALALAIRRRRRPIQPSGRHRNRELLEGATT